MYKIVFYCEIFSLYKKYSPGSTFFYLIKINHYFIDFYRHKQPKEGGSNQPYIFLFAITFSGESVLKNPNTKKNSNNLMNISRRWSQLSGYWGSHGKFCKVGVDSHFFRIRYDPRFSLFQEFWQKLIYNPKTLV